MEKTKIDFNKPAFGPDAQKLEEVADVKPQEGTAPALVVEEGEKEPPVIPVEENKVPYSRFKKFHDLAREASDEAEQWRSRAERLESELESRREPLTAEMPSWWKELYGDSEPSKRAWDVHRQNEVDVLRQAREEALQAVQEERQYETSRVAENLATIDDNLEALTEFVGRDLTEKEQSEVLDIVDEYTPKGDDGNYLGATIPFDKAWEIYELKNKQATTPAKQARNKVAGLTNLQTQGEPSGEQKEKDKNWNPLSWPKWDHLG